MSSLVSWCCDHNLHLNIAKSEEMIIDFGTGKGRETSSQDLWEIRAFKFLGTIISANLKTCVPSKKGRVNFVHVLQKSVLTLLVYSGGSWSIY